MSKPERRPVQFKMPVFDEAALARADEALKSLSGNFKEWLDEEITKLQAARVAAQQAGWNAVSFDALFTAAHDLKGLGTTYEYPLVTRMAASLCRLIETEDGRAAAKAQPSLVTAHIDALRAAVRDEIKTTDHPVGRLLLSALETQVDALGVAPR